MRDFFYFIFKDNAFKTPLFIKGFLVYAINHTQIYYVSERKV